jgi:D-alanyl-D-alanine carboxypeptidase (penicillin-binding protein 5/6)
VRRRRRRGSWALGAVVAWAAATAWAPARVARAQGEAATPPPHVAAPSAALLETGQNRFLYVKNADVVRPPASMAKVMTLVLAMDALRTGRVRWNELVSASEEAYRTGGSQIWLEPGEMLPLRQLLVAIAVGSANDAAVAVAEHLAGSVEAFVARMNAQARALGMTHTRFVNPSGLDLPGQPTQTTARDMALLGAYATRYPELLRLTSLREDRSIRDGKGGLKTGYTSQAGFCLLATARQGHLRLVAVVMGDPTSRQRFEDAMHLLTWGFRHYRAVVAVRAGEPLGWVRVRGGQVPQVPAVAAREVTFTVPSPTPINAVRRQVHLAQEVRAPVREGQVLGEATLSLAGERVRVRLVAGRAVARATWWDHLRHLGGVDPAAPNRAG